VPVGTGRQILIGTGITFSHELDLSDVLVEDIGTLYSTRSQHYKSRGGVLQRNKQRLPANFDRSCHCLFACRIKL
jgi:hypothetical protein